MRIFRNSCGHVVPGNQKFCGECGVKVSLPTPTGPTKYVGPSEIVKMMTNDAKVILRQSKTADVIVTVSGDEIRKRNITIGKVRNTLVIEEPEIKSSFTSNIVTIIYGGITFINGGISFDQIFSSTEDKVVIEISLPTHVALEIENYSDLEIEVPDAWTKIKSIVAPSIRGDLEIKSSGIIYDFKLRSSGNTTIVGDGIYGNLDISAGGDCVIEISKLISVKSGLASGGDLSLKVLTKADLRDLHLQVGGDLDLAFVGSAKKIYGKVNGDCNGKIESVGTFDLRISGDLHLKALETAILQDIILDVSGDAKVDTLRKVQSLICKVGGDGNLSGGILGSSSVHSGGDLSMIYSSIATEGSIKLTSGGDLEIRSPLKVSIGELTVQAGGDLTLVMKSGHIGSGLIRASGDANVDVVGTKEKIKVSAGGERDLTYHSPNN